MSNAPAHVAGHEDLLRIVMKVTDNSHLIACTIVITIGTDGRPCVGGNIDHPEQLLDILRQLADAENMIGDASKVDMPKDN